VAAIADVLRAYRIPRVTGDRYAGAWVSSAFEKNGIIYTVSDLNRSELYLEFAALVNALTVEIPKQPQLITEFANLERRRSKSGKDSIDHPPRGSDDLANACAGVCHLLAGNRGGFFEGIVFPTYLLTNRRENDERSTPTESNPPDGAPGRFVPENI
jgi:hypothetical protein